MGEVVEYCLPLEVILKKGGWMFENVIDSLMRALENASGRSIGMVMGIIGIVVWWMVSRVKKAMRVLAGEDTGEHTQQSDMARPRRRLSLRAYHR